MTTVRSMSLNCSRPPRTPDRIFVPPHKKRVHFGPNPLPSPCEIFSLKAIQIRGTAGNIAKLRSRCAQLLDNWSQLEHENILPTYCSLVQETNVTLSLEMVSPWMKNGNVRNYLKEFPDTDRRKLLSDIAAGLNYLHQSGVVHGALNVENVVIDGVGRPLLSDFGITSVMESNREPLSIASSRRRLSFDDKTGLDNDYATSLVSSSRPVCRYMAPELLNNERSYSTTASDVYMFACLCYESVTETQPFADLKSDIDVLRAIHRHQLPSRPPAGHPAQSRGLDDFMWRLLQSCWNSNPVERPTMQQVHEFLHSRNYDHDGENPSREGEPEPHGREFKVVAHL